MGYAYWRAHAWCDAALFNSQPALIVRHAYAESLLQDPRSVPFGSMSIAENNRAYALLLLPHHFPLLRGGGGVDVKSFLMLSNDLRCCLLLLLSQEPPSPSLSCLHLLAYMPIHFDLLSRRPTFLDISPTFVVPLILSFLIMSSLVTPHIHLNILISATSNLILLLCFFHCPCLGTVGPTSLMVLQPSCILSP